MRVAIVGFTLFFASPVVAAGPEVAKVGGGEWMLITQSVDSCRSAPSGGADVKLGLSRQQCVRTLISLGIIDDPSLVKHEIYQCPDGQADRGGIENGTRCELLAPLGQLPGEDFYSYRDRSPVGMEVFRARLMMGAGSSHSCPYHENVGQCVHAGTGEKADSLRLNDADWGFK